VNDRRLLNRREALAALGVAGAGAGLYALLRDGGGTPAGSGTTAGEAPAAGTSACVLTPEQTEGPYYIEDSLVRSDVTDGRNGTPLGLRLTVQDADSCEPIEGATVEIWHCDAAGAYSGFDEDGTFLRGAQRSDSRGEVTFRTVYPGWYQGRTTHIHVKVHAGGQEVHTGQLYFDDALTADVYRQGSYAARGAAETTNESDSIYGDGGRESTLAVSRSGDGYVGRLVLGVRQA
jgi:protocatechuate 3,4-dioxygenase beta subunit